MRVLLMIFLAWAFMARSAAEDLGKEKRLVCTLERLESEGATRLKAPHLKGHFAIPRQCQTLSFYEYRKDERLSRRVRSMPIRTLLEYLATAFGLSSKSVGTLKVLKFGHCGIHDEDIPFLLKIFEKAVDWRSLQEIHLNGNHLTDKGAKALIEGLDKSRKRLSGMKELHLDNNHIGHEGMKSVLHYAKSFPGFAKLYLSQNPAWSQTQNKRLGEVLQWMPISEERNSFKGSRGDLRVHIGGPSMVRRLVEASTAMKARASLSTRTTGQVESPKEKGRDGWMDGVARLELALLEKDPPGARATLSKEHADAVMGSPSTTDKDRSDADDEDEDEVEGAIKQEKDAAVDWEEESLGVMTAFVAGCVRNPALFTEEHEDAEEMADHLLSLGYATPSMLLQVDPEDLKNHLEDSPDVVVKLLMRCTCEYYPLFIHRVETRARAASDGQVTISDLLDDPRAMHMNHGEGPLFKRTKRSVRYAGNRISNLGTGSPHQAWLPYKHTDHYLANIEPSLHERTLSDKAIRARASRELSTKKLDFSGRAGINEDYSGAMQNQKYGVTHDVMWHRSYCASPYYRKARGVGASNQGTGRKSSPKKSQAKTKMNTKAKKKNRQGMIRRDEL